MTNGEKFIENLINLLKIHFNNRKLIDYSNSTRWTNIITKSSRSTKSLIDNALDLTGISQLSSNEYYRIDNLRYSRKQGESINDINYHHWSLEATIEHENKWNDWTDEFVKLAYINCKLRIVISYGDPTDNYKKSIEVANKIANDINLSTLVGDEDEFILVFGPRLKFIKDKKSVADLFRAFIWNNDEFIEFVINSSAGSDNLT